jgi:hypothetical protein
LPGPADFDYGPGMTMRIRLAIGTMLSVALGLTLWLSFVPEKSAAG